MAEGEGVPPINYDAASRWASRVQWKERIQQDQPSIVIRPLSLDPDPFKRVEAQGIILIPPPIEADDGNEELIKLRITYDTLRKAKETYARSRTERNGARLGEIERRDLEAQGALLPTDHPLYKHMQTIAERVTTAEKRLLEKGTLTRAQTSDEFSFYITARENVNAYTYRRGKNAFFESGFITLLDKYLQETKGYGIAEDHIAAVLGHEVSHSDDEAETGYLNEEYCDVQGLQLTAEAGYNPNAMLDVEDFLIWLEDGANRYKQIDEINKKDEKHNAILPSHPDPKNRRVVIINTLRNKQTVVPNQSKPFTEIPQDTVRDVEGRMFSWQQETQARVLPTSREEVEAQIKTAQNLSELSDAMIGLHLEMKAEVTSSLAENQQLMNVITLRQAVIRELKARKEYYHFREAGGYVSDHLDTVFQSYFRGYNTADQVIGGLARSVVASDVSAQAASTISQAVLDSLAKTEATVQVFAGTDYETGKERTHEEAQQEAERRTKQTNAVFKLIDSLPESVDIARILSSDFTQHPELQATLKDLGITNFHNYLAMLQSNFRELDSNPHLKQVQTEKVQRLFFDSPALTKSVKSYSPENIADLLEKTKHYRVALLAERADIFEKGGRFDPAQITYDNAITSLVEERVRTFSRNLSSVPEEQALLFELISTMYLHHGWPRSSDVDSAAAKMAASAIPTHDRNNPVRSFQSPGLSPELQNLRIHPAYGGFTLHALIGDNSASRRTGCDAVAGWNKWVGKKLDFTRVYYGEGGLEPVRKGEWSGIEYLFRLKPRGTEEQLDLIQKRQETIPVAGRQIIEEDSVEEFLRQPQAGEEEIPRSWDELKNVAKRSRCEPRHLQGVVLAKEVPLLERVDYVNEALKNGEFTVQQVFDSLDLKEWTEKAHTRTYETFEDEKSRYVFGMALLRSLPVSTLPQGADINSINQQLYNEKLRLARYEKAIRDGKERDVRRFIYGKPQRVIPSEDYPAEEDLFPGLTEQDRLKLRLDFIFDFVKEGGVVSLGWSEQMFGGGRIGYESLENKGANVQLLDIIHRLEYPSDRVKEKVTEILELYKDRYTSGEKDKWISLTALCEQPQTLFYIGNYGARMKYFPLRRDGEYTNMDTHNLDRVLEIADAFEKLPECSYKDFNLSRLYLMAEDAVRMSHYGAGASYDHPGRRSLEQRLLHLFTTNFSKYSLSPIRADEGRTAIGKANRFFIPASEKYKSDPAAGFYLEESPAANVWEQMVTGDYAQQHVRSALSFEYRKDPRFKELDADSAERVVLYDRLGLVQAFPDSQMKDALTLFAIRSAMDNMPQLRDQRSFQQEVKVVIDNLLTQPVSKQARERLFSTQLGIELNTWGRPVTPEVLRTRFPTRHEFLTYVSDKLPEKSITRDGYIMIATEAYPLSVGESGEIMNLLFANDYSTKDASVANERWGIEFARVLKQSENVTPGDLRELVLWLVDEDRQIRVVEDFFDNLSQGEAGNKLMEVALERAGFKLAKGSGSFEQKIIATGFNKILPVLPQLAKKRLVRKLITNEVSNGLQNPQLITELIRAGMPKVIQKSSTFLGSHSLGNPTFNSIIDNQGLDNPNTKEMFFDIVLGTKGILEEPVEQSAETFQERLSSKFEGSEMHKFIDDILDISFRKGKWDAGSRKTASVVAHSLLEGVGPVRRATIIYNLLSELPKIDFDDPNPARVRSKVLSVALSSMGVLGAKLGQMDELIPKGWGSEMATLKHNTKPMPKLMVADIFSQEGLADEYLIEQSAGAASTACGYIVTNPNGEKEFAKVVRPEVRLDWREDFRGVGHMLQCLRTTGMLSAEPGPLLEQLKKLVEVELQTGREVDNVVQYVSAESEETRQKRGGIRAVKMPLDRIGKNGEVVPPPENSYMIFEELLNTRNDFIELSKLKNPDPKRPDYQEVMALKQSVDMNGLHTSIVQDFLHRSLELGSWHSDLHDGNVMVSRDGIVRRVITGNDLVLIDFGQTGSVDSEEKKRNAARFLSGIALLDRGEIAQAIYEGIADKDGVTVDAIKGELPISPFKLQNGLNQVMAKYPMSEYMTNFMKASLNIVPYLRALPLAKQYDLISAYIAEDVRAKLRTRALERVINVTRIAA